MGEIAKALNTRPEFVASRMLYKVTWNNSHLLKDNVDEEVAMLTAEEGGEIQVHGSGDLLQTLLREGTFPRAFRLFETLHTATGAVQHVYERAGNFKYCEVEVGQVTVIFRCGHSRQVRRNVESRIYLFETLQGLSPSLHYHLIFALRREHRS
jgi:hypothetical protein